MKSLSFLMVIGLLCSGRLAAEISFPNPSFEVIETGQAWPKEWKKGKGVEGQVVTDSVAKGKQAMKFTAGYCVLEHNFRIERMAGRILRLSAQVRGEGDVRFGMIIGYMIKNANGSLRWYSSPVIWKRNVTEDWKTQGVTVTIRPDAQDGRLFVGFYRIGTEGALWLDDLGVEELGRKQSGKSSAQGAEIPGKPSSGDSVFTDVVPDWPKGTGKPAEFLPVTPCQVACLDRASVVSLTLPPVIYALTGVETRIYFNNLILTPHKKLCSFKVEAPFGKQEKHYWSVTPQKSGEHRLVVTVTDGKGREVGKAETILRITDVTKGNDRNLVILMVGDSFMVGATIPEMLMESMKRHGNVNVRTLGSHSGGKPLALGKPAVEAYGGWTWGSFMSQWTSGNSFKARTKFMKKDASGKLVFALKEYLDHYNQGQAPDAVIFLLGCNDIAGAKPDGLKNAIEISRENRQKLLAEFHRVMPTTRIGVALLPPPNVSNGAFWSNYRGAITRNQYILNQFAYMRQTIEDFQNSEVYSLIPTYVGLDEVKGYPGNLNAVHQNAFGQRQLADAFEAWLKGNLK